MKISIPAAKKIRQHLTEYFGLDDATTQKVYSYVLGSNFLPEYKSEKKSLFKELHEKSAELDILGKDKALREFVRYSITKILKTIKRMDEGSYFLPKICKSKEKTVHRKNNTNFYDTEEWQSIRKAVVKLFGAKCMRCNFVGLVHVDHVKPRSKFPDLELDITNMQILCEKCNNIKGTKHGKMWDYRTSKQIKKLSRLEIISV